MTLAAAPHFGARSSNDIEADSGTHRVMSLHSTIARVMAHRQTLGITRVGETTHLDVLAIPNVSVIAPAMNYPPQPGIITVFSGKGPTIEHATASALMETVERFSGRSRSEHLVVGSIEELCDLHTCVPPAAFIAPECHLVDDADPIEWVRGWELWSRTPVLLPAWLIYTPYVPSQPDAGLDPRRSTTNGLASGNTIEEAVLHGLYELIERDAEALAFAGGHSVTLDLDTVDSPTPKDLIERFRAAGIRLQVRDITQDIDVPTFLAVAIDPALSQVNFVNGGKGTHLDPEIALTRALTEVSQSRVIEMAGIREDMSPRTSFVEQDFATFLSENEGWYEDTPDRVPWSAFTSCARDNVVDELAVVRERLQQAGIGQAFVADLTRPELRIPVARVLVPHLEHDVAGTPIGPRAEAVAAASRRQP